MKIALASHRKLNCCDIDSLADLIVKYIDAEWNNNYCAIFQQVAMVSVLLYQDHHIGQYAMTCNYLFMKAVCEQNYEHIRKIVCSPLQRLYPEVFLNKDFAGRTADDVDCCRHKISCMINNVIGQVCKAFYCDAADPFCDITYPCNTMNIDDGENSYRIKYDYRHGKIYYQVNCVIDEEISVHEVAELIARNMGRPAINPVTGSTMKKVDLDFLHKALYYEISMIRYYLLNCEYPQAGYA